MAVIATLYEPIERYGTRFTLSENHPCLRHEPPGARGVPRQHFQLFPTSEHGFEDVDADADGSVSSNELSRFVAGLEFVHLDRDGDGTMNARELKKAPRSFLTDDYAVLLGGSTTTTRARSRPMRRCPTDIFPVRRPARSCAPGTDGSSTLSPSEFLGVPKPRRFLMGTDGLGRDLTVRMVYGAHLAARRPRDARVIIGVTAPRPATSAGAWTR